MSKFSEYKRQWSRKAGLAVVLAGFFACAGWAVAQDDEGPMPPEAQGQAQAGQPAARAVRLSSVDGQVQLSQGTQVLATQAPVNTPLFEGTQISTSDDGRAEIQFEDGSVARISPNSSLTLSTLAQDGATMQTDLTLNSGLGYFEFQGSGQSNQTRVHFGDDVATVSGFTVLRINLDYPPGEVAAFSGNVHVEGNTLALDLHGGQSVKLNSADTGNYTVADTIEPDSWDTWNSDRDQALTSQEAERTAATSGQPNASNPAWSDLDANGNWYNVPGQGYVWSPYAAESASWDPYGCGSWMWTPRFGYMWVSCEPWGYMPYATGMWSYYDGFGWGWAPGGGSPWWGGGRWGYHLGATPVHYRPPHRPPGGPHGGPVHPSGHYQPYPVIAVNRLHDGVSGGPVRTRNSPLMVAGNPVQPLRPVASRPVYANGFNGNGVSERGGIGGVGIAGGGVRTGTGVRYGVPPAPGHIPQPGVRGVWNGPANTMRPPAPVNAYRPPSGGFSPPANVARPPMNTYHPPAPSQPVYRAPAPPPVSRPMPMGGGGGGHPAGGAGGGAAHPSGGGGHR